MSEPALTLLRDAELYDPAPRGRSDVLIAGERIIALGPELPDLPAELACEVVDLGGRALVPGLVDAHVHLTGGGGEAGYTSRVPRLHASELARAGVTSVVGLLGTDGTTRTIRDLVATVYGLRAEGLSAWSWTGSYELPVRTLTGSIRDDVVFVEPILGVGELAISDHRSSQPTIDELLRIASDVHVAGMISDKAGVLHLHLGDGARGLAPIRECLARSELPGRVFHPTHVNRRPELFAEALELASAGAGVTIDVTAFPDEDLDGSMRAAAAIDAWITAGLPVEGLTCSSDGGGCMPSFDADGRIVGFGVGSAATLLATLRSLVHERGRALAEVVPIFTGNVAKLLRLPGRGVIEVGGAADLLVLDERLGASEVMARGRFWVRDGRSVRRGCFEAP